VNIYLARVNSSLRDRFDYLLGRDRDPSQVHVVLGSPALQERLEPERKTKAYSFLITFRESREEFLEKLKQAGLSEAEFAERLVRDLLPEYDLDQLSVSVVAHSDTGHYHYHITVLNEDLSTGKALRISGGATRKKYQSLLGQYYRIRFGFDRGQYRLRSEGRPLVAKVKGIVAQRGRLKQADRESVKEELTALAAELYASGVVRNRDELIGWIERELGWELKRRGDTYLSFETPAGRIRLRGGVWDANFRGVEGPSPSQEERIARADPSRVERIRAELEYLGQQLAEASKIRRAKGSPSNRASPEAGNEQVSEVDREVELGVDDGRLSGGLWVGLDDEQEQASDRPEGPSMGSDLRGVGEGRSLHRPGAERASWRSRTEITDRLREAYAAWEGRRKQELELVKQLPPELVLNKLGLEWKWVGSQIMCLASWRGERRPSVSIQQRPDTKHWVWRDHGVPEGEFGAGGTWIDLVQVARGLSYVEAVRELRGWMREVWGADFDLLSLSSSEPRKRLKVIRVESVSHPALRHYLRKRGIRLSNLPFWLKEVHWKVLNEETGELKHYFGLGVQNVNGGWLVRNPFWKGVVGPGGPAIAGENNDDERKALTVVEGIFDALAVRQAGVGRDFLILGGGSNIAAGLKLIEELKPRKLVLALDRDRAGLDTERALLGALPDGVEVLRLDIGPYKDPAEALTAGWKDWNLIEIPEIAMRNRVVWSPIDGRNTPSFGHSPGL